MVNRTETGEQRRLGDVAPLLDLMSKLKTRYDSHCYILPTGEAYTVDWYSTRCTVAILDRIQAYL